MSEATRPGVADLVAQARLNGAPRADPDMHDQTDQSATDHDRVIVIVDKIAAAVALGAEPELAAELAGLAAALRIAPIDAVRLDRLRHGFRLSAFELDVALIVGLVEEHPAVGDAYRLMHPLGEPRATAATICSVLRLEPDERRHVRVALESGALQRHQLVAGAADAPLPERSLRLLDGLWSALCGIDRDPDDLQVGEPVDAHGAGADGRPTDPRDARTNGASADRVLRRCVDVPVGLERLGVIGDLDRGVVQVIGGALRPASDVAGVVGVALAAAGRGVVATATEGTDATGVATLFARAVVSARVPLIVGDTIDADLDGFPGVFVVCSSVPVPLRSTGPTITIELGARTLDETVAMWSTLAPELAESADMLAGLLRVDRRLAAHAIADARAARALTHDTAPLNASDVIDQVRRRSDTRLPASTRLVRPSSRWGDLVVSPDHRALLDSVVARAEHQVRVLRDWGFSDARGTPGARVLLTGPPGTGKTLSAEVIATELGLDLLVVDFSALVSKWLGETEKNIAEVFDAAERCQALLFFDEADAIFARRTDASDAQGRWANLETAYLLGRLDRFEGLVALATNLRGNIDDAFVRRLDVIVDYDEPTVREREALWRIHLPSSAPLATDVDIAQLAANYEVTGGIISNATLAAAFDAAAHDHDIDQRALVHALHREYQKAGRSFPGVPPALDHTSTQHTIARGVS